MPKYVHPNDAAPSTKMMYPHRLSGRHKRLIEYVASGMKVGSAAAACGIKKCRAAVVLNSPLGRAYMEVLNAKVNDLSCEEMVEPIREHKEKVVKIFEAEAVASVETLINLRDNSSSEQTQLKAAQDLLDRAGLGATQKNEQTVHVSMNESLKAALDADQPDDEVPEDILLKPDDEPEEEEKKDSK